MNIRVCDAILNLQSQCLALHDRKMRNHASQSPNFGLSKQLHQQININLQLKLNTVVKKVSLSYFLNVLNNSL